MAILRLGSVLDPFRWQFATASDSKRVGTLSIFAVLKWHKSPWKVSKKGVILDVRSGLRGQTSLKSVEKRGHFECPRGSKIVVFDVVLDIADSFNSMRLLENY